MSNRRTKDLGVYHEITEVQRIVSRAVQKAQEESRRLGVPNVYCINGVIYYELPSGELSVTDPYRDAES